MAASTPEIAIPEDLAFALCGQVRRENLNNPLSFAGLQCWGCVKFSKSDPRKMCINNKPGYRGCYLVNKLYDARPEGPSKAEPDTYDG